jgi:hypothetical protein
MEGPSGDTSDIGHTTAAEALLSRWAVMFGAVTE